VTLLFLFLVSLSFSLSHVSDPCPLAYKREGEDPVGGLNLDTWKYPCSTLPPET
jgi:hypothetical protein